MKSNVDDFSECTSYCTTSQFIIVIVPSSGPLAHDEIEDENVLFHIDLDMYYVFKYTWFG